MKTLVPLIGYFVCDEMNHFYTTLPHYKMYVEVDLVKNMKEYIDIWVRTILIHQKVVYVNLPNTCYRC